VLRQCEKLESGRAATIDYVFASEVRLGTYKSEDGAPPGAHVARHREQIDPNDKVQRGERVPFVIIHKQETSRLRDLAVRPEGMLFPPVGMGAGGYHSLAGWSPPRLNAAYYILKRVLPALARVFSLIGVDVFRWYKMDGKRTRRPPLERALGVAGPRAGTLLGFLESNHCVLCDKQCRTLLCDDCRAQPADATVMLTSRLRLVERRHAQLMRHCLACTGARDVERDGSVECRNLDCPHLYTRLKLGRHRATAADHLRAALQELRVPDW
jgi:DNA polymerase zeta